MGIESDYNRLQWKTMHYSGIYSATEKFTMINNDIGI